MEPTQDELEFLSIWAREEWEPACYQLPAHRLQLAHGVSGADLIMLIKAWTEGEGKKDQDILDAAVSPRARWPWPTTEDFRSRFAEADRWRAHRERAGEGSEARSTIFTPDEAIQRNPKTDLMNERDTGDGLAIGPDSVGPGPTGGRPRDRRTGSMPDHRGPDHGGRSVLGPLDLTPVRSPGPGNGLGQRTGPSDLSRRDRPGLLRLSRCPGRQ